MAVQEIINLPMDEFNERLSKYDLSETQLSLIRDIRRRGKNKVAAQNCRKRKLDQIICLADEVKEVRKRKDRLYRDRDMALSAHENIKRKFAALHKHVFQVRVDQCATEYSNHLTLFPTNCRIFAIPKEIRTHRQRTAYNSRQMDQFSCYPKTTKTAETTPQTHPTIINITRTIRKIEAGIVVCLVGKIIIVSLKMLLAIGGRRILVFGFTNRMV